MMLFDLIESALNDDLSSQDNSTDAIRSRAIDNLRRTLSKKFTGDRAGDYPSAKQRRIVAWTTFCECNRKCEQLNEAFAGGYWRLAPHIQEVLGDAQQLFTNALVDIDDLIGSDPAQILLMGEPGPGAAGGAEDFDIYSKMFSSEMPVATELSLYLWNLSKAHEGSRRQAELDRTKWYGPAFVHRSAKWDSAPKDNTKDRSIVVPQNGTAILSRGMGILLEGVLTRLGLCIDTQPNRNRFLAMLGSLPEMEGYNCPCTIDLRNASDLIYIELIRFLTAFLPNVRKALFGCRSTHVVYEGDEHVLHMLSTMGNGYTFPLQTLVFWCISLACLRYANCAETAFIPESVRELHKVRLKGAARFRTYGVFGDDIVVPAGCYNLVLEVLEAIGLEPNSEKSFGSGSFRESCGSDWFHGYNVRGVYCKKLDHPTHIVTLFNRLMLWSSMWQIPLHRTLGFMWRALPDEYRNFVPMWESDDAGIKAPGGLIRHEHIGNTLAVKLGVKSGWHVYRPWRKSNPAKNVQEGEYRLESMQYTVDTARGLTALRLRHWSCASFNGYILCAVRGAVELGTVTVRANSDEYHQAQWCVAQLWDELPAHLDVGAPKGGWMPAGRVALSGLPGHPEAWPRYKALRRGAFCAFIKSLGMK